MLVGGAAAEIVSTFSDDTAGLIMLGLGLIGAVITAALHQKGSDRTGFLNGSILLMTTAMHIDGLYLWAGDADLPGAIVPMLHAYVATITLAVGIFLAAFWSATTNRRGIFNAAMTFGGIHAYTQAFETFYDEPLAYVIGGLAAIPLAWGLWRLNTVFEDRHSIAS